MDQKPTPVKGLEAAIGAACVAVLVGLALWGGYAAGLKAAPVLYAQELGPIRYVDVPGPERIVKEPYEQLVEVPVLTPVPGPTVYVPVPGKTIVKKISVPVPRHCPAEPSVADALNEYEAIAR